MSNYAIIVDPVSSGALYAEELIKHNIIPIAVLSQYPIPTVFEKSFKQADFNYIFTQQDNDEKLIEELSHFLKGKELLFVLAGAEPGIHLADKLSQLFCPHLSNGTELTHCRRNKYDMHRKLDMDNIRVPKSIKTHSIDEVILWSEKHQLFPAGVIIKPLNSAGTDSVTHCYNDEEIQKTMTLLLGKKNQLNYVNHEILAQEYLKGTEYVVDTVSRDGHHMVTNICRYQKITANQSEFVYDCLDFLPESGDIQYELMHYTFQVLNSLKIKHGPAHSEIMYTQSGPQLIETGARLHGGIAIQACRMATGNSQLDATLNLFLNKNMVLKNKKTFTLKNPTKIVFLISYFENKVRDFHSNLQKIKNLGSFGSLKLNVGLGHFLKKTVDLASMPGLLILSHPSLQQVEEDYQQIRHLEKDGLFII